MNINISAPPELSGDNLADVKALHEWCGILRNKLCRLLYSLDGENITSISTNKLSPGVINTDIITMSGMCTNLSGASFSVNNPDGSQYIKLVDGKLYISAESVIINEQQ